MDKKQKINCDVCCCTHHCDKEYCCTLNSITVVPDEKNQQAHYCKNFKTK